jgi:hypothetical protein
VFAGNQNITSITLPGSITDLDDGSLTACAHLTNITVDPSNPNYTSVSGVLFNNNLTTLAAYPGGLSGPYVVPDGVTNISGGAFGSAGVTAVSLPNTLIAIGSGSFACPYLTNIFIPASVTSIGANAFACAVTVDPLNSSYSSADGVFFDKTQTLLIHYPNADPRKSYIIPASVTSIGASAFDQCENLTNILIPEGVTNLGSHAFDYCDRITKIRIPSRLTNIPEEAFASCTHLTSVVIPAGVTNIESAAFENSGVTAVYFEGNAPTVMTDAFHSGWNKTIFYMPGTTGWSPTFAGSPTVLWNPQMQQARVQANSFGFTITGTTGLVVVVEASTNLSNSIWQALSTNTLTAGASSFSDSAWSNFPSRFYRLRSP